jgi:hypothetical protein
VNFNVYLDRESAALLARLARSSRKPRNALVREAVRALLDGQTSRWPRVVSDFAGDPSFTPFEQHRVELAARDDDPFANSAHFRGKGR